MKRTPRSPAEPSSTVLYLRKHGPAIQRFLEIQGVWPPRRRGRLSETQALVQALLAFNAKAGPARLYGPDPVKIAFAVANRHAMHRPEALSAASAAPAVQSRASQSGAAPLTRAANESARPSHRRLAALATDVPPFPAPPVRPAVCPLAQARCDAVHAKETRERERFAAKQARKSPGEAPDKAAARLRLCSDAERFYKSHHWLALRYAFLRAHGGDPACFLCHRNCRESGGAHVDHIKPRSLFPELALDFHNLQILCSECDLGKSNRYADDWRTPAQVEKVADVVVRKSLPPPRRRRAGAPASPGSG